MHKASRSWLRRSSTLRPRRCVSSAPPAMIRSSAGDLVVLVLRERDFRRKSLKFTLASLSKNIFRPAYRLLKDAIFTVWVRGRYQRERLLSRTSRWDLSHLVFFATGIDLRPSAIIRGPK